MEASEKTVMYYGSEGTINGTAGSKRTSAVRRPVLGFAIFGSCLLIFGRSTVADGQ